MYQLFNIELRSINDPKIGTNRLPLDRKLNFFIGNILSKR